MKNFTNFNRLTYARLKHDRSVLRQQQQIHVTIMMTAREISPTVRPIIIPCCLSISGSRLFDFVVVRAARVELIFLIVLFPGSFQKDSGYFQKLRYFLNLNKKNDSCS